MVYLPMWGPSPNTWVVGSPAYVVKSARAASMAPEIRALLREYASEAPMYRIFTMEGLAARALGQLSFTMLMLAIASGLALILGAIGLYGVLSYVVSQRTQEIALRMALGAEASDVRRMVVLQGGRVALLGVGVGVVVALGVTSVLESLLYGVQALDAPTFHHDVRRDARSRGPGQLHSRPSGVVCGSDSRAAVRVIGRRALAEGIVGRSPPVDKKPEPRHCPARHPDSTDGRVPFGHSHGAGERRRGCAC